MQNIVWKNAQNDVCVTLVIDESVDPHEHAAELQQGAMAGYEAVAFNVALPEGRLWRPAWDIVDGALLIGLEKARDHFRMLLRLARVPRLAALDVAYMQAQEHGDAGKLAEVSAQKQRLRDLTKLPDIDAAQTVGDLESVWPADFPAMEAV